MKILVKAKPQARENKVEQLTQPTLGFDRDADGSDGRQETLIYKVAVTEPPTDNRANEAIVRLLAEHFGVSRSQVRLISGHTARQKLFDIEI